MITIHNNIFCEKSHFRIWPWKIYKFKNADILNRFQIRINNKTAPNRCNVKCTCFETYLILLYTSSSAMSRPSREYVVSTKTKTFGSIRSRASERWSGASDDSIIVLSLSMRHRINGSGLVSRWMKLQIQNKQSQIRY